ncbi:MAG: phospho-sugar mutase [Bacillota bacterium]|nr:phospho-sugar mutase [Bacillota bacterium]
MDYKNIYERWVNSSNITEEERNQLKSMTEDEVYEAFYKYAEFGTAGMRGIMGLGTNRLNTYTIRMAAKGMADMLGEGASVAVAYDTRNNSVEFADETAKVLAAAGIKVYLFDRYSPVPLLSFAVRHLNCDGGVVITASHNTSEYNGFKVYDNTGCQMNTELAGKIAANIAALNDELNIPVVSLDDDNIQHVGDEVIEAFLKAIDGIGDFGDKEAVSNLDIVYTSIHGSGRDYVLEALENAGFNNVTLIQEQAEFDGDFPTVKKPNPEDKAAFTIAEGVAIPQKADIIIGTDPDCDRIGIGVVEGEKVTYLSGNQAGALLIDYLARTGNPEGKKLITTIVTGEMGPMIAKSYGVEVTKVLTGFKYIGEIMNNMNLDEYFMGYEESYGYLPGTHARDKDGVSAALSICQMAAYWKAQGKTLADVLSELYAKHGYWIDRQQSFTFEGSEGEKKIKQLMVDLKASGKEVFSKVSEVKEVLDYNEGIDGLPASNVLKYVFGNGSWIAARPSGTEPKIKFYYCITAKDAEGAESIYEEFVKCIQTLI